jgi:hypothetical protein
MRPSVPQPFAFRTVRNAANCPAPALAPADRSSPTHLLDGRTFAEASDLRKVLHTVSFAETVYV